MSCVVEQVILFLLLDFGWPLCPCRQCHSAVAKFGNSPRCGLRPRIEEGSLFWVYAASYSAQCCGMRDTYPVMNKSPLRPYLIGLEYRFVRHGSRARFGIVAIVCLPRPRSGLQGLVGQPSGGSVESRRPRRSSRWRWQRDLQKLELTLLQKMRKSRNEVRLEMIEICRWRHTCMGWGRGGLAEIKMRTADRLVPYDRQEVTADEATGQGVDVGASRGCLPFVSDPT